MGIFSHIKFLVPVSLYALGIILFLMGFQKKGHWALLFLTFIIPLRNIIEKIQDFPFGNQYLDILIIGVMASLFFSQMSQRKEVFVKSSLNTIIVVLVCYTFLSLMQGSHYLYGNFFSIFEDNRIKDWKNFCLMPLLFFLTINQVTDKKWVIYILLSMVAANILMDYYTVGQIHAYSSLVSREKITGTFQFLGPNEVAAFFNEYTIIMLGICLCTRTQKVRWFLLAMICANTFCILFLYSRGAYLGYGAGMFVLFAIKNKKLLIPLILVGVFWQALLPEKAVERVKETKNEYGQLDESSERRIQIWQQGLDLFKKNPITGIGFNVFGYLGFDLKDTHNIYVKFLVEQGVVGLIIFLIVIFCFFKMGYILYKKGEGDDLAQGMGVGLMACIAVILVNNMFGNRWMYFELSAYLWIFTGLVGRMIILQEKPQEVQSTKETLNQPKLGVINQKNVEPPRKKKVRYYDPGL